MERLNDLLDPSWPRIFEIAGFAQRMGPIRQTVRPGLQSLAALLSAKMGEEGFPVFPHVASHMRRRVNPPDETWLALGPEKRGYKAYGHLGVFIGKEGCSVRFVVKDEAAIPKKKLGVWLSGPEASAWFSEISGLLDYGAVHGTFLPARPPEKTPKEMGDRLVEVKTAGLDLGWPVPFTMPVKSLVETLKALGPLYRAANGS